MTMTNATQNATSADVLNRLHSFLQLTCVLIVCILGILAFRAYDAVFVSDRDRAIAAGVEKTRQHLAGECWRMTFRKAPGDAAECLAGVR